MHYRAEILEILGHMAEVRFVDYGNRDVVPTNTLLVLPMDCATLPAQARRCHLFGLTAPGEGQTWAESAVGDISQVLLGRKLVACVQVSVPVCQCLLQKWLNHGSLNKIATPK